MFRSRSVLSILVFIFFSSLPSLSQAVDVSGVIDEDTTWSAAESPYKVTGNIKISNDATLIVRPGVTVIFQKDIKPEAGFFISVEGTLMAQGTEAAPIVFTAEDRAIRWGGIIFTDLSKDWDEDTSTGCIIDHCIIEYAGNSTIYGTAAISTFSAQPRLSNNTIRYTSSIGISATDIFAAQSPSGEFKVEGNHIHNHVEGVRLAQEGARIENNFFMNNGQAIVVQTSSNDMVIKNNTIANTRPELQGDGIDLSLDRNEDDNGIATYVWEQISGTPVDLQNSRSPFGSFATPNVGGATEKLVFDLTVTDDDGRSDTESLEIVVYGTNEPPVANAGVDQSVQQGRRTVLSAAGSFDPDYGIQSHVWEQVEGRSGSWLSSTTDVNPTFTAPANVPNEGETFTFQVTVTDTGGLQAMDAVDIKVYRANIPPVADAGDDLYATTGTLVRLDGSNSIDPGGGIAAYSWLQTTGSRVTLAGADTARPSFVAPATGGSDEELIFELTVLDTGTPQIEAKDTIAITVLDENIPPLAITESSLMVEQEATARLLGINSFDPDRRSKILIENNLLSSPAETAGLINISLATIEAAYEVNIIANQFNIESENGLALYLYNWPPVPSPPDIILSGNWWGSDKTEDIEKLMLDGKDDFTLPEIDVNPAVDALNTVGSTLRYPPMADAGGDIDTSADTAVTLDGSGTYDPDNIATYAWTQLGGPAVNLKGAGSVVSTFVAPLGGDEGSILTFQLRVSIDGAFYDTDEVVVNVARDAEPSTADHGDPLGCFIHSIR